MRARYIFCTSLLLFATFSAIASGIFTLHGKLTGLTETEYTIQTKSMVYQIKKSELSQSQIAELTAKKNGQDLDLVVSTESVPSVRDLKK